MSNPSNPPVKVKKPLPPKPKDYDEEEEEVEEEAEVDEEEVIDEEEEEEEAAATIPFAKATTKSKLPPLPTPSKTVSKKGNSPLADAFNKVKSSKGASDIPAGKYEAIIRAFVLQPPDAKGQSARVKFELCDPQFKDNNTIPQWFKLLNAQDEEVAGGIWALEQALAKLGYDISGDELEECFEQISEENPGVIIKVSYDNVDGTRWQRAVIQGLCNNALVQEYKENQPF